MMEHRGYKFSRIPNGWRIFLPSGTRIKAPKQTEASIKKLIDELEDSKK